MATGETLFDEAASRAVARHAPLAARMRPNSMDGIVGQDHLIGPDGPLRRLIEADRISSVILWGPPGSGKTTMARLIATVTGREFVALSAVNAGVKDIRETVDAARRRLGESGRGTILFLDEVHRFNRAQQDSLLPHVEDGTIAFVGATTENPYFEINGPLLSRSVLYRTHPLGESALVVLLERAAEVVDVAWEASVLERIASAADGDARRALTAFDVVATVARTRAGDGKPEVRLGDLESASMERVFTYSRDEHYDMASALIKSIRGSDVDAGIYWMVRIVEAGGDPRFIARRLVILASEDIGMADPSALQIAVAAAGAVDLVGLPEASLNLAQAVVHLARAPKSNAVVAALSKARAEVHSSGQLPVPAHLRDTHYGGAASLGHGEGYLDPHVGGDDGVARPYLPDAVAGGFYPEGTVRSGAGSGGCEQGRGRVDVGPGGAGASR